MTPPPTTPTDEPLNARQIIRIEAVHQGFLYQHLYAVLLLLSQPELGWEYIRIERDEDIEVQIQGKRAYIQVKKRAADLSFSDISGSLTQFRDIQSEHDAGRRNGNAELWIVSNANPSGGLRTRIDSGEWPLNAFLRTPTLSDIGEPELPMPATSIEEQFAGCVVLARRVEHSTLSPETLVWKLAAWVQSVAAGQLRGREITPNIFQPLLEQLVVQLQQFPQPSSGYRPQEHEPAFISEERIRLITGISGSGKTAWAGEFGLHRGADAVFFDCSDLPSTAVASSLVRELAVRIFSDSEERKVILLPGVQGVQGLRLLNRVVSGRGLRPCCVLDNVQRMASLDLLDIVESLPSFEIVLLGHPGPSLALVEGRLQLNRLSLEGWSIETIAEEAHDAGCFADPPTCEDLRQLTAGSPLFVRDVCKIAAQGSGGDIQAANQQIKGGLHERLTYQELVIEEVLGRIGADVLNTVALMTLSTIPLVRTTALDMEAGAQQVDVARIAGFLREASGWGIVQSLSNSRMAVHEAFQVSLSRALVAMPEEVVQRARRILLALLLQELQGGGIQQYMLMAKLFLDSGNAEGLVEMATSSAELVREHGVEGAMRSLVEQAATQPTITPEGRFWALDSLAFWAIGDGRLEAAQGYIDTMGSIFKNNGLGSRARSALAIKELGIAGHRGNLKTLSKTMGRCKRTGLDAEAWRIARYTYAVGLHLCGENERVVDITTDLVSEYYEVLGIELRDVLGKNLGPMAAKLGDLVAKGDDIKHLADCLDLQAKALLEVGRSSRFCRIHAHKFYLLAESPSSAIKVGQDYADECLRVRADPEGARQFLEGNLLPIVREKQLLSYLVPVSCQYAVVLAYCGEESAARQTLREMEPFIVPGTHGEAEYLQQCALTEDILERGLTIESLNRIMS
jgi:hypothetical protein